MNLQPRTESIFGQKEFLRNSVGTEYKTGGATLDASQFTAGEYVKAGTAVFKDDTSGLYHPWDDTPDTGTAATAKGAGLTSHDVKVIAGQNPVVGVLSAGHPLESKCTGVNDKFKEATKGRLVFDI
ncbi:hypothetical protein GLV94_02965 [Virgibacillus halodenitrificans]|uniref:hypothetical protein n=1 Tax=Virgibacillus halodenitrificans TaxID=1482 RepID=UPI00136F6165|nr:hypothetical protein [Virgibacillus halodenitrificans]MYL44594.1 hypothetical protein [Virgibacillus halodenitrificans]